MFEAPYLKRLQQIASVAIPGSNPRFAQSHVIKKPALEFDLPLGKTEVITVDRKAWRILTEEDPPELSFIAPLESDTGTVIFHVTSIFVKSVLMKVFPHPGTNNVQQFMGELAEGSDDYEKFMGIFKFFMMIADGTIFHEVPSLQIEAKKMVAWLRNDS